MYSSLGDFLRRLDAEGELLHIRTRVDTEYEIAEITDRMCKSAGGGRALLFENTREGYAVATNLMGSDRRMAMALGVERLEELTQRIDSLLARLTEPKQSAWDKLRMLPLLGEMSQWLPRTSCSKGECQQRVWTGEEASFELLPVLKCWAADGGRFITLPMVNTVDAVSGVRNVGMYRMQIFDAHTAGMHWHCHKTGARHFEEYRREGRRMPVSVALGGDPAYTYAATAPMPDNMDEYMLAGFLRRRAVRLVKCITNDIYVPSDCDFVLEGYVDPNEPLSTEGDFGDHTGFYSLKDLYPAFHLTAVTARRDAVYPATVVGVPPEEDAYIAKATERIFLAPIRLALQPEVCDMTMPIAGTAHNIAVVALQKRYDGQPLKAAQGLWGAGQMMFNKYMVMVSQQVDVRSRAELSALVRNADVDCAVKMNEGIYDVLDHSTATCGYGGKMLFDLTSVQISAFDQTRSIVPQEVQLCCGVEATRTEFADEWAALALFSRTEVTVEQMQEFLHRNALHNIKYVALFEAEASALSGEELLWLAAANTDPRRDVHLSGGVLFADAKMKTAAKSENPARWPNVVTASATTIKLVDECWNEYGIGEFLPSPSLRYCNLVHGEAAEVEIE